MRSIRTTYKIGICQQPETRVLRFPDDGLTTTRDHDALARSVAKERNGRPSDARFVTILLAEELS